MHQQQGPPAMHMGMGLPMNPMLAAGAGVGAGGNGGPNGVFNPAFLNAGAVGGGGGGAAGTNQSQGGGAANGGFGFDPTAAFNSMPGFGMGMPDFTQMGMMNMMGGMGMGMGGMGMGAMGAMGMGNPFGGMGTPFGGMSPFGSTPGGMSPMSTAGMDGAGSGDHHEAGPKKRTRTD